ncbi:MAG: hypothetical protein GX205_06730 [Firmicutes bacterium]|nr:hypothetical protein [Bacillota bacterium]
MWEQAQVRLRTIIQTDVMGNEEWDFLATHVPFEKLFVTKSGKTSAHEEVWSEEDVFRNLIMNPGKEHRFIIVRGDHGAGKSHLVRWLHARIKSTGSLVDYKVVFIRRIENNLQGALKQMLEQGVISRPEQQERIRRFLEASQVLTPLELKLKIYFGFLAKLEADQSHESVYKEAERQRLALLLSDQAVKDHLLRPGGPIDRFYSAIFDPRPVDRPRAEAVFLKEDFMDLASIMERLSQDHRVKRVFAEVTKEVGASKLARYLNGFSDLVIQEMANLAQGDIASLMKDLREDLKRKDMGLIVLIEDLTTFTGIQTELVKILSVAHGGEYSELCPILAIVGLTNAYYENYFRGNFQDRVTHQIVIKESSYDEELLARLAAKYINAAYLTTDEVKAWFARGADQAELPYRTWEPEFPWDTIEMADRRRFSLFPLTRKALIELFGRLANDEQNPRFFLRNVVRSQLDSWFGYRLGVDSFPDCTHFVKTKPVTLEWAYDMRLENSPRTREEKQRLRLLVGLWGDGTLEASGPAGKEMLAGLPLQFFDLLGYQSILDLAVDVSDKKPAIAPVEPPSRPTVSIDSRTRTFQNREAAIKAWYHQGQTLAFSDDMKKLVYDFIIDAVDWLSQGVPAKIVETEFSHRGMVYIEGQSERSADEERTLITVKRDKNGYEVLMALCHWDYHNSSWNFDDGPYMQYLAVNWLESKKQEMVDKLKGPSHEDGAILGWSMALEYIRLGVNGNLHPNLTDVQLLELLFKPKGEAEDARWREQGTLWHRLQIRVNRSKKSDYENSKVLLVELFRTKIGSPDRASLSQGHLYHRKEIDDAFRNLAAVGWDPTTLLPHDHRRLSKARRVAVEELNAVLPELKKVLEAEEKEFRELVAELGARLGEDLDEKSWRRAITQARKFLSDLSRYNIYVEAALDHSLQKLEKKLVRLVQLCAIVGDLAALSFHKRFALFSANPNALLRESLETIEAVEETAADKREFAAQQLKRLQDQYLRDLPAVSELCEEAEKIVGLIVELRGDGCASE